MTRSAFATLCFLIVLIVAGRPIGTEAAASESTGPRHLIWASIGDSYSSGEGIPGTTTKRDWHGNNCQRADGVGTNATAWGPRAKQFVASDLNVASFAFTACTGALADAAVDQLNEAQSLTGIRAARQFDIVTFSFGGNNIGFPDVIKGCLDVNGWGAFDLTPGCDITEQQLRDRIDMLVGKRPLGPGYSGSTTLPELYDQVAGRVRPGGDVIVVGYPQLVEEVARWSTWQRDVTYGCEGIQGYDVGMLRSAAGYLNQQIALAVQAADARHAPSGVHFTFEDIATKVYETGDSPNARHGLCSKSPWLNGETISLSSGDKRIERSFHPTQQGHKSTASDLAQVLRYDVRFDDAPRGAETIAALSSAQVPSLCEHPAGRLVNGKLPGIPEIDGFVALDLTNRPPVTADFDGDGEPETVAIADCSRGGVGWPNSLLAYSSTFRLLDEFKLEDLGPRLPDYDSDRGGAFPLQLRNGQLRSGWIAQRAGDIGAGGSLPVEVTLDIKDGRFVVVDAVRKDERPLLDAILAAANAGDRQALMNNGVAPVAADGIISAVQTGGALSVSECTGEVQAGMIPWVRETSRSCLLKHENGANAWAYFNLAYDHEGSIDSVTWTLDSISSELLEGGD